MQALQGVTVFTNSGQISHDEVFSPEMVVLDREIVASVERFMKGLDWDDGAEVLDRTVAVMRERADSAHFLDHDATLEICWFDHIYHLLSRFP